MMFLPKLYFFGVGGLEWTWNDLKGQMGIAWEFRGKNLELLGLVMKELQFYLGTSWE